MCIVALSDLRHRLTAATPNSPSGRSFPNRPAPSSRSRRSTNLGRATRPKSFASCRLARGCATASMWLGPLASIVRRAISTSLSVCRGRSGPKLFCRVSPPRAWSTTLRQIQFGVPLPTWRPWGTRSRSSSSQTCRRPMFEIWQEKACSCLALGCSSAVSSSTRGHRGGALLPHPAVSS